MKWRTSLLVLALFTFLTAPLEAQVSGIFTSRRAPTDPEQRLQTLIGLVQSCHNPTEREQAIQELRNYDASKHPQVVPVLISVLRDDKAISVRIEAARSLGRIRPLTAAAREALVEASTRDAAFRVRWQARTSLTVYTVASINPRNYPGDDAPTPNITTKEPPLAGPFVSPKPGTNPVVEPPRDPVFQTPPPREVPYDRPLPRGPDQPLPAPGPPQGTLVPQPTGEPPLAPDVPPLQPVAPQPQPQPLDEPLPQIPIAPTAPNQGPILVPLPE